MARVAACCRRGAWSSHARACRRLSSRLATLPRRPSVRHGASVSGRTARARVHGHTLATHIAVHARVMRGASASAAIGYGAGVPEERECPANPKPSGACAASSRGTLLRTRISTSSSTPSRTWTAALLPCRLLFKSGAPARSSLAAVGAQCLSALPAIGAVAGCATFAGGSSASSFEVRAQRSCRWLAGETPCETKGGAWTTLSSLGACSISIMRQASN